MVLHISHTRVLKKFLQFVPSSIVGVKLLQGEGDCFGGLLGACHPHGGFWLETYKGASIHGHIEEDAGFRALRGQLAAQGASDCERNYGEGEGQLCACLRRCQARGMFTRGKGNMEGRMDCGFEDTREVLGLDCRSLSKEEPGATKKKRDPEKKGRRREVVASQTSH